MGFIEDNPVVFIVAVILIVEVWTSVKRFVTRYLAQRRGES